jgi:glyoxylate reductase
MAVCDRVKRHGVPGAESLARGGFGPHKRSLINMTNRQNIKILIARDFPEIALESLKAEGFSVTTWNEDRPMTQTELIEKAKEHNALLCTLTEQIDKVFLSECPHLEIISQYGVGYDNINVTEATRLGIPVGYTPGATTEATADVAFGLMIAASRKMFYLYKTISKGEWDFFRPKANLGMELKNKTLGIFGLGRIGFEMAKRCKGAYDMEIIYHNRKPNLSAEKQLGARLVNFDDLLKQSDVISVHCSLSSETKGIFNKEAFGKMKRTAIFINTSRGPVHNENDLIEALNSEQIWGAGLDVANPEPMQPDNLLLSMENVAVLPHIGSGTFKARGEMSRMAAENIIEFYKNKRIPNIVNPETMKNKTRI